MSGFHSSTYDSALCNPGASPLWHADIWEGNPTFSVAFDQALIPPGNATVLYECVYHCFAGMVGAIFIQATGVEGGQDLEDRGPTVLEYNWGRIKARVFSESPR